MTEMTCAPAVINCSKTWGFTTLGWAVRYSKTFSMADGCVPFVSYWPLPALLLMKRGSFRPLMVWIASSSGYSDHKCTAENLWTYCHKSTGIGNREFQSSVLYPAKFIQPCMYV